MAEAPCEWGPELLFPLLHRLALSFRHRLTVSVDEDGDEDDATRNLDANAMARIVDTLVRARAWNEA